MTTPGPAAADFSLPGRPVVFRNATVLTMDDGHHVLRTPTCWFPVTGSPRWASPRGARGRRRDRRDRRHRHARHDRHPPAHVADRDARVRRGLDAHPVLRLELPAVGQVVPAAGHLRGQPAVGDRGDRRGRHHFGRLVAQPADGGSRRGGGGRAGGGTGPVRPGYGNIQAGPWEWSAAPEFRDFVGRRFGGTTTCLACRWPSTCPGDPDFPEKAAFEVARELDVPVTTHAGVWKRDQRRRHPAHARARFMTP